jgi:hypothetical protein
MIFSSSPRTLANGSGSSLVRRRITDALMNHCHRTAITGQRKAAKYSNRPSQQPSTTVMHIYSDLGQESSAQDRR